MRMAVHKNVSITESRALQTNSDSSHLDKVYSTQIVYSDSYEYISLSQNQVTLQMNSVSSYFVIKSVP
jgi:hypothetical protein